ncbi:PilW family protein [Desulfolithobacter sp.]
MSNATCKAGLGNGGFTIVELMITLVISGIIVAAIYSAYIVQQRTYTVQNSVSEMQQNLRAGLMLMTDEIRLAGLDEQGTAGAGITSATVARLNFTLDRDGDGALGGTSESISFGFRDADDADGDGMVDDLNQNGRSDDAASLGKDTGGGYQSIADNIQAIEFYYFLADGTETTAPAQLDQIRAVQVSVLARAAYPDPDFTNTRTYTTASGASWGPFNDNYRRRLLIMSVQCRNLGL